MTQQEFIKRYTKPAQTAGKALGIPWQWVLAQWGMETNWGNEPHSVQYNNPGNIMASGVPIQFQNMSQFLSEYVNTMRSDFPFFVSHNKGTAITPTTVFGGPQAYDPLTPNQVPYDQRVLGGIKILQQNNVNTPLHGTYQGNQQQVINQLKSLNNPFSNPSHIMQQGSHFFSSLNPFKQWSTMIAKAEGLIIGLVLVVLGLVLIVAGEKNATLKDIVGGK